jgi:tetratricopeptide (TPR) repeat protein
VDKLDDFGIDKEKEWEPDTEKPWNEEQWEKSLLEENERLMDKYRRVLGENPRRYKHPLDLYYKVHYDIDPIDVCQGRDCEKCEDKESCETYYLENIAGREEGPIGEVDRYIWEQEGEDDRKQLESIACYQSAQEFDESVGQFLNKFNLDKEQEEIKSLLIQLSSQAFKVHANILGGHCFGYDDDVLCANIVKCRWAVKNIDSAIEALGKLAKKLPNYIDELAEFQNKAELVKKDIILWIESLRIKVWWD